jgi:hypothetical protein
MSITTPNGSKITAGVPSLFKNTPAEVKWVYRALGIATLLWAGILQSYGQQITQDVQIQVFKALACGTTLTYIIAQFFGITLPTTNANNSNQPVAPNNPQPQNNSDAPVVHLPHPQPQN